MTPRRPIRFFPAAWRGLLACAIAVTAAAIVVADPTVPAQVEVQQQQIKSQMQQVRNEIGTIIAEYQVNGLGASADVEVLGTIQKSLGNLSQEQMSQVLELLSAARREADPGVAREKMVSAAAGQSQIAFQLQVLLLQYQRQHDIAAIALRMNVLAERQHANLRLLRRYARVAPEATVFNLTVTQKEYLQTQIAEQDLIGQEIGQQLTRLESLSKEVDEVTARRLAAMRRDATESQLLDRVRLSMDELTRSHVGLASSHERAVRDTLRRMARLGAPPMDSLALLRSAGERLVRLIQLEGTVAALGGELGQLGLASDRIMSIEDQQAELVDETDELARDLSRIVPGVAHDLVGCVLRMQQTRVAILKPSREQAVAQAMQASAELKSALATLTEATRRLERLANAFQLPDRVAALKDCITALRLDEERLAAATKASGTAVRADDLALQQGAYAQTVRELVPFAGSLTEVADLLGDAAKEMDEATAALGSESAAGDASGPQSAAITALKKAEALLEAKAAQLAAALKDLADFRAARERLIRAIIQQERVAVETGQLDAVQKAATTLPAKAPDAAALSQREAAIRQIAGEVRQLLANRIPAAVAALVTAGEELTGSYQSLKQSDAHAALPRTRAALAALQAAKEALDKRISELLRLLELPEDPTLQLDELNRAIEQTVHDLTHEQDPLRQAAAALAEQQRQIASDLHDLAAKQPDLKAPAAAADQAADRLDRNQPADAGRQMQAALDGMKAANDKTPSSAINDQMARQKAVLEATQALANQQAAAATPAAQAQNPDVPPDQARQLAGDLTRAAAQDQGDAPTGVLQAMSQAEQALADAAAQSAAGDQKAAQAARAKAVAALGAAQKAIGAAKQGQQGQMASPTAPGQGQTPQPGPPVPPGPPMPGTEGPSGTPTPTPGSNGTARGPSPAGPASYINLPPRDRAAIEESRMDRYPQDYAPMIEMYFKNLSEKKE